ncbi:MAG: hypothetical protein IJJ33_11060 [Victivallales bacterium]|nr:hypothetical protein [Victivallales bacterium]
MRKIIIPLLVCAVFTFAEGESGFIPFTPLRKVAADLRIDCEMTVACSAPIVFPAVPQQEGMTIVLKLNQRILAALNSGWNCYCGIEINGRDVEPKTSRGFPRLLLRGSAMNTTHPSEEEVPYWQVGVHPYLLSVFGPRESDQIDSRVIDRKHGYDYYLIIDDLVNKLVTGADDRVESDTPNRLRFLNGLFKNILDTSLYIKEATIGYIPTSKINELCGLTLKTFQAIDSPASVVKGDGFLLKVSRHGGMELAIGECRVYFETLFSHPSIPVMQFNRFGVDGIEGEPGANASVEKNGRVLFRTNGLEIRRAIRSCGHYLRIVDRLTNVSKEDAGVVWKNEVAFSGEIPAIWRLAGVTGSNASNAPLASMNPTIYLSNNRSGGVGLIAEDTISRTLLEMRSERNVLSLSSKGAGLQAGKSLTLEWTIYPLPQSAMGYFDFINQVRKDWGVNATIPGPFHFSMRDAQGIRLQFAFLNKWHNYSDGWRLTDDQFMAQMKALAAPLRSQFPGIRLLGKVETNLVPMKVTDYDWHTQLPMTRGDRKDPRTKYAQYLPPDLSRKLAEATPYRDSLLWNDQGGVMIDNWYTYDNHETINLMVQVESGNHRHKTFLEQVDLLMDKAGLDGLYIDQFNPGPRDGIDYGKWDGVSVNLDKAGRIVSKYYNYALQGAVGRMEIIRHIVEKGGIAFTNGHPMTREEQNSGRLSFVEMENDGSANPMGYLTRKPPETSWTVSGHLASPITLNLRPSRYASGHLQGAPDLRAQFLTKGFILALRNATIPYCYTSRIPLDGPTAGSLEVINWLLPFTPVRIDEGVMVGKERTIVCVSGNYTVRGAERPQCAKFNCYGKPVPAPFEVTGGPGDWHVNVKLDDWNEIAAIVVQD